MAIVQRPQGPSSGTSRQKMEHSEEQWRSAIHACLPKKLHAANEQAFAEGRRAATATKFQP